MSEDRAAKGPRASRACSFARKFPTVIGLGGVAIAVDTTNELVSAAVTRNSVFNSVSPQRVRTIAFPVMSANGSEPAITADPVVKAANGGKATLNPVGQTACAFTDDGPNQRECQKEAVTIQN